MESMLADEIKLNRISNLVQSHAFCNHTASSEIQNSKKCLHNEHAISFIS